MASLRPLRIVAAVELVSLIVLFTNLATLRWQPVAALVGPIHGCAYLAVIVLAVRRTEVGRRTRALAMIPGFGGLLVLWRLGSGRVVSR